MIRYATGEQALIGDRVMACSRTGVVELVIEPGTRDSVSFKSLEGSIVIVEDFNDVPNRVQYHVKSGENLETDIELRGRCTPEDVRIALAGATPSTPDNSPVPQPMDISAAYSQVFVIGYDTTRITEPLLAVVALGLCAYKTDNGKYPGSLDALAPKYLQKVPEDFCSGKPFIYKSTGQGYILYSVGENMKDDGGKTKAEGGDDLVVKTPPVPASRPGSS